MNGQLVSDRDLLGIDLFAGDKDDAGARCCSSRMVTTRKPHICVFSGEQHDILVGTRARVETAIIDNRWGSFYVCCGCLEGWLRETCGHEVDTPSPDLL